MPVTLSKRETLGLFCLARQAERSIDFAITSERQWALLRQYYESGRLQVLQSGVRSVQARTPMTKPMLRDEAFQVSTWSVLTFPIRRVLNRFLESWCFREAEFQFILQTLQAVVGLLNEADKPEAARLVQMRMDLHACEVLIARKLIGVPELDAARRIEHFCQAPHIQPFRLDPPVLQATETRRASA